MIMIKKQQGIELGGKYRYIGVLTMDMQVWSEFLQQNWLVIAVALVVLFLIVKLVKTVIKWVLVIAIAAFIIVYSGISLKDIGDTVNAVKDQAVEISKHEVTNLLKTEAKDAEWVQNADGTFTITSPNLEITGKLGEDKVKVKLRGLSLGEWSMSESLEAFIGEAQQGSK